MPENARENANSEGRAAAGAAVDPQNAPVDPDLQEIVKQWAKLPEAVKAGISAMVQASKVAEG